MKAILVGLVINQGRIIHSGRYACLTKQNVTEMLRASRRNRLYDFVTKEQNLNQG